MQIWNYQWFWSSNDWSVEDSCRFCFGYLELDTKPRFEGRKQVLEVAKTERWRTKSKSWVNKNKQSEGQKHGVERIKTETWKNKHKEQLHKYRYSVILGFRYAVEGVDGWRDRIWERIICCSDWAVWAFWWVSETVISIHIWSESTLSTSFSFQDRAPRISALVCLPMDWQCSPPSPPSLHLLTSSLTVCLLPSQSFLPNKQQGRGAREMRREMTNWQERVTVLSACRKGE